MVRRVESKAGTIGHGSASHSTGPYIRRRLQWRGRCRRFEQILCGPASQQLTGIAFGVERSDRCRRAIHRTGGRPEFRLAPRATVASVVRGQLGRNVSPARRAPHASVPQRIEWNGLRCDMERTPDAQAARSRRESSGGGHLWQEGVCRARDSYTSRGNERDALGEPMSELWPREVYASGWNGQSQVTQFSCRQTHDRSRFQSRTSLRKEFFHFGANIFLASRVSMFTKITTINVR